MSWPPQRRPFRPLNRTERVNRLLVDAISQAHVDDSSLDGLELSMSVNIPDSVVGMPDSDAELAAAVLRQLVARLTIATELVKAPRQSRSR